MARRGLKLKVTGQDQLTVGLTSILDQGQCISDKTHFKTACSSRTLRLTAINTYYNMQFCILAILVCTTSITHPVLSTDTYLV